MEERQVSGRRPAAAAARARSSWPRPRTRSSTRAPTRCRRPSSTGSCSRSSLPLPPPRRRDRRPAPARGRLRPARPGRRRPRRGRRARPSWPPGAAAVRQVAGRRRRLAYIVDLRAPPGSPRRCGSACRPRGATALMATSRAWAWLNGRGYVTPDDVKALARAALRAPPLSCGRRPSWRASTVRRCARRRARGRCPSRADGGRPGLARPARRCSRWHLARRRASASGGGALGVALVRARLARPAAGRPRPVPLLVRGGDTPRSGSARPRRASWSCPTRDGGRCGASSATPGRPPRARTTRASRSTCRPASGARCRPQLTPTRRGDRHPRPGDRARVRPARSGRAPALARRALRGCAPCPVRLAQAPARAGWPGCASSTAARRCGARAGHRVRLAARLRRRRRRALDRLARDRAPAVDLVVRTWQPERTATSCWSWTPAARPPAGSATHHGWTRRWTPRCCSARWRPGRRPGRARRRRPGGPRPGAGAERGALLRDIVEAMAPLDAASSRPTGAVCRRGHRRGTPALARGAAHPAGLGRRSRRVCCPSCRCSSRTTGSSWRRCPTPASPGCGAGGRRPSEVYDAAAAERTTALRARTARALGQLGVTVIDADPETLPVRLADHYLWLKGQGLL